MGVEVGGGGTEKKEEEEGEKKEKIPLCGSIGHRLLRGRCPAPSLNYNHYLPKQGTSTADHLTLLSLFCILWISENSKGKCPNFAARITKIIIFTVTIP